MTQNEPMQGLIPHLCVDNAVKAIEFYKKAFGAEEQMRMPEENGTRLMHAQMSIGGNVFFLCDDFPEYCGGKKGSANAIGATPVTLHRYVPDVDAAIKRAADAGATVTMPAEDMFWGDRYGRIKDPFGHEWSLATPSKKK